MMPVSSGNFVGVVIFLFSGSQKKNHGKKNSRYQHSSVLPLSVVDACFLSVHLLSKLGNTTN